MTVIGITWSKGEIKDLSFIIDNEIELKTIEPADAALLFGCQPPEHFMGMLTLDVADSLGSDLIIDANSNLIGLTGLEGVTSVLGNLEIYSNSRLSTCEVKSICDYLANPNGTICIQGNAVGCNNQEEVEEACETIGLGEGTSGGGFTIYPNPFSDQVILNFTLGEPLVVKLEVLNNMGQVVATILDESLS